MLEHLQRLPVETVSSFLESRDAKKYGIPPALGKYILELNEASNLFKRYRSVAECSKQLQKLNPELSLSTCRQRVCDAISFFNTNSSITNEAWCNYFADEMMKLADINLLAHNFPEVRRCFERAKEYRQEASANVVDRDLIQFKPQLVSADFKLERMGDLYKGKGILNAWSDIKEIIGKDIDATQSEKERLLDEAARELGIVDTEFEETE